MTPPRLRSVRIALAAAASVTAVVALVALGLTLPGGAAAAPALPVTAASAADPDGAVRISHPVVRSFADATGAVQPVSSYDVTVSADQTRDLRGRQRVLVSWKGAQPSAGRASNPFGENGLSQEYPVVVMQCRGTDDASLPLRKQLRPQTCWTASRAQRSQINTSSTEAAWVHDLYADDADKADVSGLDPIPAQECPGVGAAPYYTHLTAFEAAKGTVFPACNAEQMPPEAAVGAAFPPAEVAAFTDENGNGSVQFEVRSDVENESLGCNHETACAIVVVPIAGLSCDRPASPATATDKACRKTGRFAPGSSNFAAEGIDQAVGPALWWSASNWRNRFTIPITFGLPPDACDVLDSRPPTGFYGSELLAQAALQWSPAYCLNKQRFKFQLNQMSDEAGFALMENGQGPAAVVSSEHRRTGSDPVAYAPTAVTGFGIGYVVDKPDNAGEFGRLRLNPRLIAKLLTQSYLGSDLGRGHPGIGGNPIAIMADPEFIRLNKGLSQNVQEVGATLLSLSNSADVVQQLTEYLAQDKDAMAFVHGKPDPWGMVVNPRYQDIELPRAEWPLLDTYVPKTESACRQANPSVYFNQLAAPVTTLRKIAEAVLDGWPNVQTRCDFDPSTGLFKTGRVDRQSFGSRFMVGVVSLGDAERFGLDVAALQTRPGTFVAPDDASLRAGVALMEQRSATAPFRLDQADVARSRNAYPGTMVVYTAARTRNLEQTSADQVAQFIRVSTSEGQRRGTGNGQLPAGFLPITAGGPTGPLLKVADEVADLIEAQRVPPTKPTDPVDPEPTDEPDPAPDEPASITDPSTTADDDLPPPEAEAPPTEDPVVPISSLDTADVAPTGTTTSVDDGLMGKLFPALLGLVLLSGLYTLGSRFFVRPPRRWM